MTRLPALTLPLLLPALLWCLLWPLPAPAAADPLALSAAERAWLQAQGTLVFAYREIPPFALRHDGRPRGYSIEVLEQAAALLGVPIEFRQLPTPEALAALRDGAIDGVLNLVITEQRAADLHYSERAALVEPRIFAHRHGPTLTMLADLAGRRVAVWPTGLVADLVTELDPPPIAVPVPNQRAALQAVATGAAEATIMDLRHGRWLLADALITDLIASPRAVVSLRGALFAVARGSERLAGLLDRAVAALPPAEIAALQAFWFERDSAPPPPVAPRTVRLSEAERAFLRGHPEVVLGIDATWEPLVYAEPDGSLRGIDVDTLDLIGATLGIQFRLEAGVWEDMVRRAKAGEIDGLSASVAHPERGDHFLFTRSYLTVHRAVFVRTGNPLDIRSLADLAGKRVGYQQANLNDHKRIEGVPGAIAVGLPDPLAMINALGNGSIDAVLNNDGLMFQLARQRRTDIMLAFLLPEQTALVFSIRQDWPELVSAMDKVLATLTPAERLAIAARYLRWEQFAMTAVPLSAVEREWLAEHSQQVRYCFSPVWRPYDYLEDGVHRGLFRDQLTLLGEKLGVTFEPVVTATWRETLERSRAGDCDLLSGAVATAERRAWLDFTKPFMHLIHVLVAPAREPFVGDLGQLAGQVIAVPADTAISAELPARYPALGLLEVDDLDQAVAAIRSGQAYAALATLEHAANVIQRGAGELRVIAQLPDPYPVSIAVRRDQPVLLRIMDKALASLSEAERDALSGRATRFTIRRQLDLTQLWPLLAIALVAAGFLLLRQRELSRLNHALGEARDAAEAAAAAKGRFLATMSHEMRTPMNAILGMARLCQESGVGARQQAWLADLQRAGHALLALIEDVLDLSRHEAGALRLHPRPFLLDDLLQTLAGLLGTEARERGLGFHCHIDPQVPAALIGDPQRLQQVLLNLAGNALKFTPSGWVRVEVRLHGASATEATLKFSVSDSGIGIDAATRARLYQPFSQGDSSLARRHDGVGLGLAISQELVGLMGGRIDCESSPGRGSRFAFTINCPRPAAALPWHQDRRLAGKRVRLCVDDVDASAPLAALLAAFGLVVRTDPGDNTAPDLILAVTARPPVPIAGVGCCWYIPPT